MGSCEAPVQDKSKSPKSLVTLGGTGGGFDIHTLTNIFKMLYLGKGWAVGKAIPAI